MNFNQFSFITDKTEAKLALVDFIAEKNWGIAEEDFNKPWGGYFRIADENLNEFIDLFFPEHSSLKTSEQKLRPKFLLVAPNARLSWQYHHRRAEVWKVLFGPIGVMQNTSDDQTKPTWHQTGELIEHDKEIRHRLMGADNWGLVAEIWKHTDPELPSEEDDIVRVQDDYGR